MLLVILFLVHRVLKETKNILKASFKSNLVKSSPNTIGEISNIFKTKLVLDRLVE